MRHNYSDSEVGTYDKWNDAIFGFFFGPQKTGRDIRLTFDDVTASAIAEELNLTTDDFINSVADLLNPAAADPFGKFRELVGRERDTPSSIGILAAQVLVASRMHADNRYSASAFWPRFNQLLLRRNVAPPPHGCEILGQFWRLLAELLNERKAGQLGRLRIPENPDETPLRGWCHVNYPLSQCLIREVDRRDLAEFFLENAVARECPLDRLVGVVAESHYAFGKTFAATLRQAVATSGFALELGRALSEIRAHVISFSSAGGSTSGSRRRVRTRLKMTQRRGEYVVVLQHLFDDWRDVARLDADQWENGLSDDRAQSLWSGAEYTMFVEGADGFVTSRERMRSNMRARVLCSQSAYEAFESDLRHASGSEMRMAEALEGLRCFQFVVDEKRDSVFLLRLGASSGSRLTIRLEGGLDVGHGRFVQGSEPRILLENLAGSRVAVNRVVCEVDGRGYIIRDRTPKEPGTYEVSVDDTVVRYSIVDLSEAEDSSDGGFVGYALSVAQAIMITQDLAVPALENVPDLRILVGADLQ